MKINPRFAFFGTPQVAVHVLDALERHGFLPALVVTAPDRKQGRGLEESSPPAKKWAEARGIEVVQPATLKDAEFMNELGNTQWDVFIVAAYTKLIPKQLLDMPRHGCLNMHPSLLPKLRGASPVISAILEDERETGVSVMLMEEKMDAGPIIAQARIEIDEHDWPLKSALLEEMLATEGGNLLCETLPEWLAENVVPEEQDDSRATYTKKCTDENARIVLSGDAMPAGAHARKELLKIRAFDRSPRAHFFARDKNGKEIRIIITEAEIKDGKLHLLRVIPESKREMAYEEFLRSGAVPIM